METLIKLFNTLTSNEIITHILSLFNMAIVIGGIWWGAKTIKGTIIIRKVDPNKPLDINNVDFIEV